MRLPRQFRGSWSALAGGSFALLLAVSIGNLVSRPSAWIEERSPAEKPETERTKWVADARQYPPALLREPGRLPPADLPPVAARNSAPRPGSGTARSAWYEEQFEPGGAGHLSPRNVWYEQTPRTAHEDTDSGEWRDERLPELSNLDPPRSGEFGLTAPDFGARDPHDHRNPPNDGPYDRPANSSPQRTGPAPPEAESATVPRLDQQGAESFPGAGGAFTEIEPPSVLTRPQQAQDLPQGFEPAGIGAANRPAFEPQFAYPAVNQTTSMSLAAVSERANELCRHGFSLAERGAYYSAKAEFIQALRLLTQAQDGERGDLRHSHSLAAGLTAIEEAEDFVPKGTRLEADLDVAAVCTAHETPVLKSFTGRALPLAAVQRYYSFAQERLAVAGGNLPSASAALYGLGRVQLALGRESADARRLCGPKAMTFYHAALIVDGRNYRAANELGVLLAKYGQLPEAKRALLLGLSVQRHREGWHNLAVVHERLGEADLARRARHEAQLLAGTARPSAAESLVRWVNPQEFSATGPRLDGVAPPQASVAGRGENRPAPASGSAPSIRQAEKKSTSIFWPWK